MRKKLLFFSLISILLLAGIGYIFVSTNPSTKAYAGIAMRPSWDVADNILAAPDNQTFASLIYHTQLTTFLHGEGPFTVFAPTEQAYKNLQDGTKSYLLDTSNQGELRQTLLYHVVKGRYPYASLKDGMKLTTVAGEELTFSKKDGILLVNNYAYVQTYDVFSTNGVIHIITNYLIPPGMLEQ